MDLPTLLIFYFIIVISLVLIFRKYGIRPLASWVFSTIIGQIILNLLYPPTDIDDVETLSSSIALYYTIQYITPVFLFISLSYYAINDSDKNIESTSIISIV
jgi:hypothetical protein